MSRALTSSDIPPAFRLAKTCSKLRLLQSSESVNDVCSGGPSKLTSNGTLPVLEVRSQLGVPTPDGGLVTAGPSWRIVLLMLMDTPVHSLFASVSLPTVGPKNLTL